VNYESFLSHRQGNSDNALESVQIYRADALTLTKVEGMFDNITGKACVFFEKNLTLQRFIKQKGEMGLEIDSQHPYIQIKDILADREVIVFDDVDGVPVYGDSYLAPDLLIVICHEGTLWDSSMLHPIFGTHDVGILLPDQIVVAKKASDDYRATIVAVSRKFCNHLLHSYPYTRHTPRYRRSPATHLSDEQYNSLLHAVSLLRTLSESNSPHRSEMLTNLLAIVINVVGEYHASNHPDKINLSPNEQLFNRFYDALIQHHCESHEMAFYARLCCLSPKHFSEVIKHETGISATEWIANYITNRAKSLLDSRLDYSIQQVSDHLGFCEQSAFTRFFKKQTGITPSYYRDR